MPPSINWHAANEARRLIYIKMQRAPDNIIKPFCQLDENGEIMKDENNCPRFLGNSLTPGLIKEMPMILFKAKKCYEKFVKNSSFILSSEYLRRIRGETLDVTSECYIENIQECFEKSPNNKIPKTLFLKIISNYLAQNGKKIQPFEKEKYERAFINLFKLKVKTINNKTYYMDVTVTLNWVLIAQELDKSFEIISDGKDDDGFFLTEKKKLECTARWQ